MESSSTQKVVSPPAKAISVAVPGTTTPPRSKATAIVPTDSKTSGTATGNNVAFGSKVPVDEASLGSRTPVTAAVNVTPAGSKISVTGAKIITADVSGLPGTPTAPTLSKASVDVVPVASKGAVDVVHVGAVSRGAVDVVPAGAVSKASVSVIPPVSKGAVDVVPAVSKGAVDVVPAGAVLKASVSVVPVVTKGAVDVVPVGAVSKAAVDVVPAGTVSKASVSVVPVGAVSKGAADVVPVVSKASVNVVPAGAVSKASVDVVPVVSKASVSVVPVVSKGSVDVVPAGAVSKGSVDVVPPGALSKASVNVVPAGVVSKGQVDVVAAVAVSKASVDAVPAGAVSKVAVDVLPVVSRLIVPMVRKEMSSNISYSDDSDSSVESESDSDSESDVSASFTPGNEAKQQLDDVKAEIQRLVEDGERSAQAAAKRAEIDAERMRSKAAAAQQMDELAKIEIVTIYQNREEVMKQIGSHSRSSEKSTNIVEVGSSQTIRQPPPVARLKGPIMTTNTGKVVRLGNEFELSGEDDDFSAVGPEYLEEKSTFTSSSDLSRRSQLIRDKDKESNVSSLTPVTQKLSPSVVNPIAASSSTRTVTPSTMSVPLYGSISIPSPAIGKSPLPVLSGSLLSGGRRTSGSSLTVPPVSAVLPMSPPSASKFPGQSTSITETSRGKMWGAQSEVKPSIASQNQIESQIKGKEADNDSNLDFDTSSWDEEDDADEND